VRAAVAGRAVRALAVRAAARLPVPVRRLAGHEVRCLHSLWLWVRRRRHGVGAGAHPAPYNAPQNAMMWSWIGLSAVETAGLALIIPWPLVHAVTLYLGVYGLVLMTGMQAACVTRPHVVEADGSLRLRQGGLFDLRIPAEEVVRLRAERRFPDGRAVQAREDGSLELIVAGQTTVTAELTGPVGYVRPLGRRGTAHTVRFHADDTAALIAAFEARRPGTPDTDGAGAGTGTGTGTGQEAGQAPGAGAGPGAEGVRRG
jgi:hypothetical protein